MVLYSQLGVTFVFTGAQSPRFSTVKVFKQKLGALTHIFPNFADLQCFCLDCRFSLSLSQPTTCMCAKRGTNHICQMLINLNFLLQVIAQGPKLLSHPRTQVWSQDPSLFLKLTVIYLSTISENYHTITWIHSALKLDLPFRLYQCMHSWTAHLFPFCHIVHNIIHTWLLAVTLSLSLSQWLH